MRDFTFLKKLAFSMILSVILVASTHGDDAYMPKSGNEMGAHSNRFVQMLKEHIQITAYNTHLHAVCDFIFFNHGAATQLKMGFPDYCDPGDDQNQVPFNYHDLYNFHSWVDGRKQAIQLVRNPREPWDSFWFEKEVRFRKDEEIWVRDSYNMPIGLQDTAWNIRGGKYAQWTCHNLLYVIHTGSTWLGNIKNAEIDVKFSCPNVSKPFLLHRGELDFGSSNPDGSSKFPPNSHDVWYSWNGFVDQSGNTLIFTKRNFKPTEKDDLLVSFEFPASKS